MSTATNTPVYPSIFNISPVLDDAGVPTGKLDIDLVFATGDKAHLRQISLDGKNWYTVGAIPPNNTWYGDLLMGPGVVQQSIYRFIAQ